MGFLRKLPLFVILSIVAVFAMYFPMAFAIHLEDWATARAFFYNATFFLILISLLAISQANGRRKANERVHLLTVFGIFVGLPTVLAMPFNYLIPEITFFQAYWEMVSCLTTTGATLFQDPNAISDPLHLWRALVAWLGGFFMLIAALAVFAPLNLGGFEVYDDHTGFGRRSYMIEGSTTSDRLRRYAEKIAPIYLGLTSVLALCLLIAGDRTLVAVIHAMSILSTSGISPVGGLQNATSGRLGEVLLFVFLAVCISRHLFRIDRTVDAWQALKNDKEVSFAVSVLFAITSLLFLRHWTGAFEVSSTDDTQGALSALWGTIFTCLSFLTTTGFESSDWTEAQKWSGLNTPGLILMGLAVLGGGIATTTGGIKLLRIYALYKHGLRELGRLSFPNSIAGAGDAARRIRRDGARIAWIMFMLFISSIAVIMLALSLTGLTFSESLTFAIASLSTTGPLVGLSSGDSLSYAAISDSAKAILALAMILGRLEALAVIALINPQYWR